MIDLLQLVHQGPQRRRQVTRSLGLEPDVPGRFAIPEIRSLNTAKVLSYSPRSAARSATKADSKNRLIDAPDEVVGIEIPALLEEREQKSTNGGMDALDSRPVPQGSRHPKGGE